MYLDEYGDLPDFPMIGIAIIPHSEEEDGRVLCVWIAEDPVFAIQEDW